ncbi:MAG: hypothetical protein IKB78_04690 [Clostridia bacterium]|nr:hypothetical protein [Clostridia bacterium]
MKRLLACLAVLFLLLASAGAEEAPFDFKQFRWGDGKDAIIAVEGAPAQRITDSQYQAEVLCYHTTIAGLKAQLSYMLGDAEGLFIVVYSLQEKQDDATGYIGDYDLLREVLTGKYGTPVYDDMAWNCGEVLQEVYQDDLNTAFRLGYVTFETVYETDTTMIFLTMEGEMFGATTELVYQSKTVQPSLRDFSNEI